MPQLKKCHYVSEFYLNRFTNADGKLWVYDLEQNVLRPSKPKNETVISYYYWIETSAGKKDPGLEKMLGALESDASVIIDMIAGGQGVRVDARERLSAFLALFPVRGPQLHERMEEKLTNAAREELKKMFYSLERTQEILDTDPRAQRFKGIVTAKEVFERFANPTFTIKRHRNDSLRMMVKLAPEIGKRIRLSRWLVFRCPKNKSLVTNDVPLMTVNGKYSELLFPLDQSCYLVIGPVGAHIIGRQATRDQVRAVNEHVVRTAHRLVFGRDKELLLSLLRSVRGTEPIVRGAAHRSASSASRRDRNTPS